MGKEFLILPGANNSNSGFAVLWTKAMVWTLA
jgi:hypothetical protein